MPACITHYYFAKKVLDEISAEKRMNIDETAFYWGAQGPDFLFCHNFLHWRSEKSLNSYSYKLHREKPSVIFNSMRKFTAKHSEKVYISYAYGFACHYALDSEAHPYVEAFTYKLLPLKPKELRVTMHGEIESALEAIVLRRETGKLPTSVNLRDFLPKNHGVQLAIAKLYSFLIEDIYGETVEEEEILKATKNARFVFGAATDRTTLKKKLFDRLERKNPGYVSSHLIPMTEDPDIDYANVNEVEWESDGKVSNQSFFELFDGGVLLAAKLIESFESCDFAEVTSEKPFWVESDRKPEAEEEDAEETKRKEP